MKTGQTFVGGKSSFQMRQQNNSKTKQGNDWWKRQVGELPVV